MVASRSVRTSSVRSRGRAAACAVAPAWIVGALAVGPAESAPRGAFLPSALLARVHASPNATFRVIVQGAEGTTSRDVAAAVAAERAAAPGAGRGLERRFASLSGVSAQLTGKQIAKLAARGGILAITPDAPVASSL